jgi:PAS domain S-box-containing protein
LEHHDTKGAKGPRGRRQRRAHQRSLDHLFPRSELILNAAVEGIYGVDVNGIATFVNPAAARLLGWEADELIGRPVHALVHHSHPDGSPYPGEECPVAASYRDGVTRRVQDEVFWRRDGSPVPVEYTCTPIVEDDNLLGAVVVLRDISDRKEASKLYGEVLRLAEQQVEQNEMVARMQQALFPPLPDVDELDVGVHFLAADESMPTGGDMYDVQVLPNGDVHVVVLDVMGKGVGATTGALAVVHTLRVLVAEEWPLDLLVHRADELLAPQDPSLVATMVIGRYRPITGRLQLAGGGHPPVLVVSPDGSVREVMAPGIALGWPGAGSGGVVETTLARSETALLYTDGLIEASKDVIEGLAMLHQAAAETVSYPARHLARSLVERALADVGRHDDTLALVLRRRTPLSAEADTRRLGPFEYRFTPSVNTVALARRFFADWLSYQPCDPACHDDLLLMVSELCTNAVKVASGAPGGVVLRAWDDGDALVVEVHDDGEGFGARPEPADDRLPDPDALDGRGLFLVRALADDVHIDSGAIGTRVRCVKRAVLSAG